MTIARVLVSASLIVILGCYSAPSRRAILFSEPPVTGDYENVYLLSRDNPSRIGTAFLVVHHGKQYLLTSKSVINGFYANRVDVRTTTSKVTVPIRRSWLSATSDLGVIILDQSLPRRFAEVTPLATDDQFNLATEAWTLGFPATQSVLSGVTRPAPFLGHAYYAGLMTESQMAFDGHAYPGGIGGPIFMRNREGGLRIVAVVSGSQGVKLQGATTDTLMERTNLMYAAPVAGLTSILDSLTDAPADDLVR